MATEWISRNAVFAALDMCAVLEHYQINVGRGSSFRIHCPFHEDDRPSCSVDTGNKVFNCFGCEAQGNVLDFIAAMEGLDSSAEFRTVLETAIDILGHNPSPQRRGRAGNGTINGTGNGTGNGNGRKAKPNDTRVSSNADDEQSPASKCKSPNGSRSRKRSTSKSGTNGKNQRKDASVNRAGKNDSPNKIRSNVSPNKIRDNAPLQAPAFPLKLEKHHMFLEQRGFDQDLLDEFGIGYETRSNALMAGRICFPIHNAKGELVAYAGRWAGSGTNAEGEFIDGKDRVQERYKLPKGFAKQLELYNLNRVLQQLPKPKQRRAANLLVVEGFWSVLRLHSLTRSNKKTGKGNGTGNGKLTVKKIPITGIPAIALMGRTISKQQIQLLRKYGFQNIILMLDGDDEGRKATKAILPKLAKHFFVKDANLPDGTKPDDVDEKFLMKIIQKSTSSGKNKKKKNTAPKQNQAETTISANP